MARGTFCQGWSSGLFKLPSREIDIFAGKERFTTINSCLCPVGSVDGASITTVEGIGNSKAGYHAVQGWSQSSGALLHQYVPDDHIEECNIFRKCMLLVNTLFDSSDPALVLLWPH